MGDGGYYGSAQRKKQKKMGKQGREARAVVKRLARASGLKENELGELRQNKTKMELRLEFVSQLEGIADLAVRALLLGKRSLFLRLLKKVGKWDYLLVDILSKKVAEDLCRIEDARVFQDMSCALVATIQLPIEAPVANKKKNPGRKARKAKE